MKPAHLIVGANVQEVDLEGEKLTISQLIERFGTQMNIPAQAERQIQVNGQTATEDRAIGPGDQVEVLREAGSKG